MHAQHGGRDQLPDDGAAATETHAAAGPSAATFDLPAVVA